MKIPTIGKECPYFYGDYFRGKHHEECRLVGRSTPPWELKYCKTCPVPDITHANACPHMILTGEIKSNLFGLMKRVEVSAYCTKSHQDVENPYVGCGECHPIFELFK
ncbi:MAG: hypothetical protein GX142_05415 [Chloroflexi bacterium]|jgi:hypothetical protein|nr:hypothetical protein [Chloroflexota bacterium]